MEGKEGRGEIVLLPLCLALVKASTNKSAGEHNAQTFHPFLPFSPELNLWAN
jgi:hypothetical protein